MIKPEMPNMPNIPGMGAMTETLDFVKNMWSGMTVPGMNMAGMNMAGMNVPGMVMPTLSVEEINKKITDLKAVESWLAFNMNMLRSTIQALEVQSATLSALQAMGENFAASMTPPAASRDTTTEQAAARGESAGADGHEKPQAAPQPTSRDEADAASLTAPLVNAAAWWNMLQDQFQQAVSGAMGADGQGAAAPAKAKPKTSRAAGSSPGASATPRKRKTGK